MTHISNNKLEVRGVINAIGTVTSLGGNIVSDEVLESIREVSREFVDMEQLAINAGNYIAKKLGAESAYITNGASSAIVLSVASSLIKAKPDLRYKLPKVEGPKRYVLTFRNQESEFKYLINLAGAKIKELGTKNGISVQDFEKAVGALADKTAAIVYFVFDPLSNTPDLGVVVGIAHRSNIPVIVDAAAELPPKDNFKKFLQAGADIVIFSGGKAIGSFTDTGIMIGRKDMIDIAIGIGPHKEEIYDSKRRIFLGRVMKISREEIIATATALDRFLEIDENSFMNQMNQKCRIILENLKDSKLINVKIIQPPWYFPRPIIIPRVEVDFKNKDADKVLDELKKYSPPIYCLTDKGKLYINPQCLKNGEELVVSRAILHMAGHKGADSD